MALVVTVMPLQNKLKLLKLSFTISVNTMASEVASTHPIKFILAHLDVLEKDTVIKTGKFVIHLP